MSCSGRTRRGHRRLRPYATVAAVVLCLLVAVSGCGEDSPQPGRVAVGPAGDDPNDVVVEMTANGYRPRTVTVPAGGRVTWLNTGIGRATAENFEKNGFEFDTHSVYRGQAKSVAFGTPGRYEYFSSYDSNTFSGVVVVTPRRGGAPCDAGRSGRPSASSSRSLPPAVARQTTATSRGPR